MTHPSTPLPAHDDAGADRGHNASGPLTGNGVPGEVDSGPLASQPLGKVTGLTGYEATRNFRLWFKAYDQPHRGGPTHSVHIVLPAPSGHFTLVELWQGPLNKLIKDAVTQGYLRKAAEVEPVGQLELFAGVGT